MAVGEIIANVVADYLKSADAAGLQPSPPVIDAFKLAQQLGGGGRDTGRGDDPVHEACKSNDGREKEEGRR